MTNVATLFSPEDPEVRLNKEASSNSSFRLAGCLFDTDY